MGCTILMDVALEVTTNHKPWESGQVVVGLSRTKSCKQITIVSDMKDKKDVVDALWECLIRINQWTALVEQIIYKLAVSPTSPNRMSDEPLCMNMVEYYPFRTSDYTLPQSNTGYVYFLVSTVCHDEVYVGQTGRNIPRRLQEHNSGRGAHGTKTATYMPWGVGAYIGKMSHMTKIERQQIEKEWQLRNKLSRNSRAVDVNTYLQNGKDIVLQHNSRELEPEKRLSFHQCIVYC